VVTGSVRTLLRLEGGAAVVLAVALYVSTDGTAGRRVSSLLMALR